MGRGGGVIPVDHSLFKYLLYVDVCFIRIVRLLWPEPLQYGVGEWGRTGAPTDHPGWSDGCCGTRRPGLEKVRAVGLVNRQKLGKDGVALTLVMLYLSISLHLRLEASCNAVVIYSQVQCTVADISLHFAWLCFR